MGVGVSRSSCERASLCVRTIHTRTHTQGITPTLSNTGLFAALEAAPEVMAVFVGHDHCNDFCCKWGSDAHPVDLCFGHHSGFGGYDCPADYGYGSRVIAFQEQSGDGIQQQPRLSTYVRMTNGSVVHRGVLKR